MATKNDTRSTTEWQGDLLHDATQAHNLRLELARAGCYPTADTRADAGQDFYERNIREALLPDALARLDRNDLQAVYRVARLLATHPARPDLFEAIGARQRVTLEALVRTGALPARVLEM